MSNSLHHWLKPVDQLPLPKGPLSAVISPAAIENVNKEVCKVDTSSTSSRGAYAKLSSEQQATIAEYASLHGNDAAVRRFSKELGMAIKESSVRTWKVKYQKELQRKRQAGETDLSVKSLPSKKRGRPLLLGEKMDKEVKSYICAVREGGGVVTTAIAMAAATAIVRGHDRNLLIENGGSIAITKTWGKSLLQRMGFVKRRGSSAAKLRVADFDAIQELFLLDYRAIVEMEEIPPELVFNWDQTGISIVPGSSWTMNGSQGLAES